MITTESILEIAKDKGKVITSDLSEQFLVSRQYLNRLIQELTETGKLIKFGTTRSAFYVTPEYAQMHPELFPKRFIKSFSTIGLEEHKVLDQIEQTFPLLKKLPENVQSIFTYAFSEMLNNAIEHSTSANVSVEVSIQKDVLSFTINDSGIGVFRNVMQKRKLKSEFEAIQDLMKGKTTTLPKSHSGEGIFFTSKAGELFVLDSFGYQLIVDNQIPDVFVKTTTKTKRGTKVMFKISSQSSRHLNELFQKYTDFNPGSAPGFDKTQIQIKLYTIGGVHISRSQARRVLAGLEKFKVIVFDFDKVPVVGQAFADEIFRVFHLKHPNIKLEEINMNDGVKFMIERAKSEV
ncbi:MAG: helix-turn-helix, type 11 protein [uncultured bacterium]|nr:MAG: helix-turn-helix, type 11 protein [uncultured bacterium]